MMVRGGWNCLRICVQWRTLVPGPVHAHWPRSHSPSCCRSCWRASVRPRPRWMTTPCSAVLGPSRPTWKTRWVTISCGLDGRNKSVSFKVFGMFLCSCLNWFWDPRTERELITQLRVTSRCRMRGSSYSLYGISIINHIKVDNFVTPRWRDLTVVVLVMKCPFLRHSSQNSESCLRAFPW
jgi:hypothetical protein